MSPTQIHSLPISLKIGMYSNYIDEIDKWDYGDNKVENVEINSEEIRPLSFEFEGVCRSSFVVRRSSFVVRRSSFVVRCSSCVVVRRSSFVRRFGLKWFEV